MRNDAGLDSVRAAAGRSGVVHVERLRELGISKDGIRRLVMDGCITPVVRGWYATDSAWPAAREALMFGGRLSCVSMLRMRGVWVHDGDELHIDMGDHASGRRLRTREATSRVVAHWDTRERGAHPHPHSHPHSPTASLTEALRRAVVCQHPDFAVASLDSALHQRMLSHGQMRTHVFRGLPSGYHRLAELVDARAESGLESIARLRLRRAGFAVAVQEQVLGGRYRLDLVVNGRVVVELDGRQFHDLEAAFLADRRRDAAVISAGYVVARFAYAQVMHDWPSVERAVRALVATAA